MTRLPTSQANRGMTLERLIEASNAAYAGRGLAMVNKLPTPIKVSRVEGSRISLAHFEAKSTVDFHGVYHGHALYFDAKQTTQEHRFPFDNVHPHQIEHLRACMKAGAICFLIVEFTKRHEIFYVPGKLVIDAWDLGQQGGRKSIPYEDIARQCYLVTQGRGVACDYLAVVDRLLEEVSVP